MKFYFTKNSCKKISFKKIKKRKENVPKKMFPLKISQKKSL